MYADFAFSFSAAFFRKISKMFFRALILILASYSTAVHSESPNIFQLYSKHQVSNKQELISILEPKVKNNNPEAQHDLALLLLLDINNKASLSRAISLFKKASVSNIHEASVQVGLAYSHGVGVEKNFPEANRWFLSAAKQGYARGQYSIGQLS